MESTEYITVDLVQDDMRLIQSLKGDLIALVKRIEKMAESGVLRSADRTMLATQCIAMEMCLDEILMQDWKRLTGAIGINQALPRSVGYQAWLDRPPLQFRSGINDEAEAGQ